MKLKTFYDADWASNSDEFRNITGYCTSLDKTIAIISWKAKKKQPTVALSTCKAKYMALASVW